MSNTEIAKLLRNVAAAYSIKDEKKYRFQILAYQKAADSIENSSEQVKDIYKEGKLDILPGIGASMKSHLTELFTTGKVKYFETVLKDVPKAMFVLMEIPSFGPKKAFRLTDTFGIHSEKDAIEKVYKLAKSGKIAPLEGFGEKSQEDIIQAIDEFKKGSGKTTRMVLPFAFEVAEKLISYLKKSKDVEDAVPLGSLRRMKPTIGDLDIAVSTKNPDAVLDYFLKYPYIGRVIERGPTSSSILTTGGQQVDLMTKPPDNFGSLIQHFTGSKDHNVHLRELAIRKGLSLSDYGIKKKGDKNYKPFKTEELFYNFLGMDWIPPEIREDSGEIELGISHKLPKLVELKDIKGDLHIHSNFPLEPSHDLGISPMEEMLEKAIELGYEYLAFSEHNPSQSKHTEGQILSLVQKRQEKIEKLSEKFKKIKILSLMETDILPNGKLALPDKALALLDGTIVSIHSVFSMKKEEMTKRVLEGLSHKKAKILAHPTGRMLNNRPGYELDFEKVFTYCSENKKALEINSWPQRLDLPDGLVRSAVNTKVKMVIDTDSHATAHMDLMRFGVSVARRGWATKSDILNTLGYNEFIQWLKS